MTEFKKLQEAEEREKVSRDAAAILYILNPSEELQVLALVSSRMQVLKQFPEKFSNQAVEKAVEALQDIVRPMQPPQAAGALRKNSDLTIRYPEGQARG